MLVLAAHRGAVLAVERHVEDAGAELLAHLRLQLQALAHPRLDPAVVVAHREKPGGGLGAEQNCSRMRHRQRADQSRWATPACSSCSSLSVLLMRSWLKASIASPCTTVYLPLAVVTGKPNMMSFGMP